jgi:Protein of unknown function (DUF2442)
MAKHKVITTGAEIDRALDRARALENEPRLTAVEYKSGRGLDLIILRMSDGHRHVIPREDLEGLQGATKEQIGEMEILGNGTGIHWPALDVDHYVPDLLRQQYGTRQWMAQLGRSGGRATSAAKKKASRANGLKGGRPRKEVA